MSALPRLFAIVWAVAIAVLSVATVGAEAGDADPTLLLFSGTDLWRYGAFLYGGGLWAPDGLGSGGFTLKMLMDTGSYDYVASSLHSTVSGTLVSAAALPGWRFVRDQLSIGIFAGPLLQDDRLAPNDPGSRLHGLSFGGELAADLWYQPGPQIMAALNGAISSVGPTGYVHAAVGLRLAAPAFIGPESQALWCGNYEEFQFGAHLTALHVETLEWSAGAGWAFTSDRRSSPYVHFGVNARY